MMTLSQWSKKTGINVNQPRTNTEAVNVIVDQTDPNRSALFRLADYRVSSANGPTIWLVPAKTESFESEVEKLYSQKTEAMSDTNVQRLLDDARAAGLNVKDHGTHYSINRGKTVNSSGVNIWPNGEATRNDVRLDLANIMSEKEVRKMFKLER